MEEVRGARKEVDLRCYLEGSPPKLDFGQGWGNADFREQILDREEKGGKSQV